METKSQNYIDFLSENNVIIKRYKLENIFIDDPRYDNFEFNEDLLLSKVELVDDELLEYIEFQLTDNTVGTAVLLDGFSDPRRHEEYLETEFEKFQIAFKNDFRKIEKSELIELKKNIGYSKYKLENMRAANSGNLFKLFDNLINTKIKFCDETISYIRLLSVGLPETELPIMQSQKGNANPKRQQKQLEKLTHLTQKQIIILFHILREQGIIGINMQKSEYAKCISTLTGFTSEKIRQELSHIGKHATSIESGEFTELDFSIVKRNLNKIIEAVQKESEERFITNR